MLSRCRIQRFRGFEDLGLSGLGRINLIVGRNNSGKTSLLEALALLAAGPVVRYSQAILASRPLVFAGTPRAIRDTQWRPLFWRMRAEPAIEIRGESANREVSLKIALRNEALDSVALSDDGPPILGGLAVGAVLEFRCSRGDQEEEGAIYLGRDKVTLKSPDSSRTPIPNAFIVAATRDVEQTAVDLGDLRRMKRDGIVLEALRRIAPELKGVESGTASGKPMIWCDLGLPELLPLGVAGEGMLHVAQMVIAMHGMENGMVLFDEVENGIHHSALAGTWKALDLASREFRAQIFATTHSFECVRAAWESLSPDDLRVYRLQPDVTDHPVVAYSAEALAGTMKNGFEMR